MKRFAAAAALCFLTAWPAHAQDAKMKWKNDYPAALKEAKKQNKYIVLHFMGSN